MQMNGGKMSRRSALERVSAGTLLALGLWPGASRAASGSGKPFRFLVVNDTHYLTPQCGTWLEGVIAQMRQENADFCLHAGDVTDRGEKAHFQTVKELFG